MIYIHSRNLHVSISPENNCRIKYNVVMKDGGRGGTSRNLIYGPHSRPGNRDCQRLQAVARRGTVDWNGSTGTYVSTAWLYVRGAGRARDKAL